MLNENRVKHMVQLASYENKSGAEDIKASSYLKKDYVNMHVIITTLWVTLGYFLSVTLIGMAYMDVLVDSLTIVNVILLLALILVIYVILLMSYITFAKRFYRKKYDIARRNTKKFVRGLETLEKMYEKEDV